MNESLRVGQVGRVENGLALFDDPGRLAVVHHGRRQQAEAGMTMLLVVPREELLTEGATVLNRAEALGKLGAVLHRAKLAFRIRVVIGDVRTAMGLGDAQVGQQKGATGLEVIEEPRSA